MLYSVSSKELNTCMAGYSMGFKIIVFYSMVFSEMES